MTPCNLLYGFKEWARSLALLQLREITGFSENLAPIYQAT